VLFVATQDDLICAQATGALTAGPNNTYTPGSITFGGPLARSTWALPSPYVSKIRIKAKRAIHMGVAGLDVDSVAAPNQVVCGWLVDANPPPMPSIRSAESCLWSGGRRAARRSSASRSRVMTLRPEH
jgi:hypothetical protein